MAEAPRAEQNKEDFGAVSGRFRAKIKANEIKI